MSASPLHREHGVRILTQNHGLITSWSSSMNFITPNQEVGSCCHNIGSKPKSMANLEDKQDIGISFKYTLYLICSNGWVAFFDSHDVEVCQYLPLSKTMLRAWYTKSKDPYINFIPEKRFFAKVVSPSKSPYFHWVVYPCYLLSYLDLWTN